MLERKEGDQSWWSFSGYRSIRSPHRDIRFPSQFTKTFLILSSLSASQSWSEGPSSNVSPLSYLYLCSSSRASKSKENTLCRPTEGYLRLQREGFRGNLALISIQEWRTQSGLSPTASLVQSQNLSDVRWDESRCVDIEHCVSEADDIHTTYYNSRL